MAKALENQLAQKQRRQKIILAAGGAILLLLLALQLPKLMGGSSSESAPAPATTPAATTGVASTPTPSGDAPAATPVSPVTVQSGGAVAVGKVDVGGVTLPIAVRFVPGEGQLDSFGRLQAKDPFVPQIAVSAGGGSGTEASAAPSSSGGSSASGGTAATPGATAGSTGGGEVVSTSAPPEGQLTAATIAVNGNAVQVAPKGLFPRLDKMFVLRSLKPESARIAIAGGSFTDGRDAILLRMGKSLTLINEATGARYVLKLLYTGTAPEQTAGFTTSPPEG